MSLLERMRGSTDSTPMQIVLILIVVAFVGWYALPQGEKVSVAVEVDGERVLQQEFGQRYYQEKRVLEGQSGRPLDEAGEDQLAAEVKQTVARELVVTQEAKRLGYMVSPREISTFIKSDPTYHHQGKFDIELWKDSLKSTGRSKADVERDFEDVLLREKLRTAVTLGVTVDDATLRKSYNADYSTIDLELIRVTPDMARAALAPTANEVDSWATDNAAAIQADYDRDKAARYDLPERVTLSVIRLDATDEDREAMIDRLRAVKVAADAGTDFGQLARRHSEDSTAPAGGDLGERRITTLVTAVREGIADIPEGQVSDVIDEGDVVSLYEVRGRAAARTVPLDEVRDEIATRLLSTEKTEAYAKQLADGWVVVPPTELMIQTGAVVTPLPGVPPTQYQGGPGLPPKALVDAAAAAEVGTTLPPFGVPTAEGKEWYVARVNAKSDADPEIFDRYRLQALYAKRDVIWTAYVDELSSRAKIDTGGGEATQGGWMDWLEPILPD